MRARNASIVTAATIISGAFSGPIGTCIAFSWTGNVRRQLPTPSSTVSTASSSRHRRDHDYQLSSSRLHSTAAPNDQKAENDGHQHDQTKEHEHPHSKLWTDTFKNSPNSYISPSISLSIRDPSKGGTGIIAAQDIPADTVVMCLNLQEVGVIDASLLLCDDDGRIDKENDAVMKMLLEMWNKELTPSQNSSSENTQEGKRLAVLAGLIAHLQLTHCKDVVSNASNKNWDGGIPSLALEQSRDLGAFLDAMPLLPLLPQTHDAANSSPPQVGATRHPFPTHFLYWTDDEVQVLLQGTMAQTKAREIRAGTGLVLRGWSEAFLKEHSPGASQTQILNAIFSSFTAVLSRSFGDAAGRDLDGNGRMLVPLVDMLNHDGEFPNVSWKWHVAEEDQQQLRNSNGEGKNWETKGDIIVTSLTDIKKGEELFKCYGWRPAWDIASSYGFVPQIKKEQWECTVIPLFPAVLDLGIDTGNNNNDSGEAKDELLLDLLLESNYSQLVKAVIAAVDAANEIKTRQKNADTQQHDLVADETDSDRPELLSRVEVVSLFRPPPAHTASDFPFDRRQPCVIVGTKIQAPDSSTTETINKSHHQNAIQNILPAFRAAASALHQLRQNHNQSGDDAASPIQASQMAIAAASLDQSKNWDEPATELMKEGIQDRIRTLLENRAASEAWLAENRAVDADDDLHRKLRAGVAKDARDVELMVLRALEQELL